MKRGLLAFAMAWTVAGMLWAMPAGAEEKAGGVPEWIKAITVKGFVSGAYSYNFNQPADRTNNLRIFDFDDRNFKLDLAELVIRKAAEKPGEAGFSVSLEYGYSIPQVIHSTGFDASDDFDIKEAYLSYVAPVGTGLTLDVGKFVTHIGYEVIEGADGYNDNYSRSFLFGLAIPFTHTGVRASYQVSDALDLQAMVVNGWDNVRDNNDAASFGFHVGYAPTDALSVGLNYMIGPEKDDNNSDLRQIVDVVATASLGKSLTVGINLDYGTEENSAADGGTAKWQGVAGYLTFAFSDTISLNVRAEIFQDKDGARTGTEQDLQELTITPTFQITPNLVVRPEFRYDTSDQDVFGSNGDLKDSQSTLAVNVLYVF